MSDQTEPVMLPEQTENPFVAALPPPMSTEAIFRLSMQRPRYAAGERKLAPHLRRYCVLRLLDFVEPMEHQMNVIERIGMAIRHGYKGRNPANNLHRAALIDAGERVEREDHELRSDRGFVSTAVGFSLIGAPGMGKSLSVRLALGAFPKVVVPALPYYCTMVTSILVQCPTTGGIKQICLECFAALDEVLGTDYLKVHTSGRWTEYKLILQLQLKLQLHAVGLLAIDEIQHLLQFSAGRAAVMNFFVNLVNRTGVPVLLIGTLSAAAILQGDFREARRASGIGSVVWEPMKRGEEWDNLVVALWRYQWTATTTKLTDAMREVLYDECQGIPDILVKLFVLSQFRAIGRGEGLKDDPEELSPELVRAVASEELAMIAPMIRALRRGTPEALMGYPDLEPLQRSFDALVTGVTATSLAEIRERNRLDQAAAEATSPGADDPTTLITTLLRRRGSTPEQIGPIMEQVRAACPSGDVFEMMELVASLVKEAPPAAAAPSRKTSKARAGRTSPVEPVAFPGDLRDVVKAASTRGETAHAALSAARHVADVAAAIAA